MKEVLYLKNKIKNILKTLGAEISGVANIDRFKDAPVGFHPADCFIECKSVIVFAKPLPKSMKKVRPEILYNFSKETSIKEIDRISYLASIEIEKMGGEAVPVPCNTPYEYWDSEKMIGKGLISMKHAACKAGIGEIGKSTLLLNPLYGSFLTMGVILTDLDLKSDIEIENVCLSGCRVCIDNCPSGAITKEGVDQKLCRNTSFAVNDKGFTLVSCNKCRILCPVNNKG